MHVAKILRMKCCRQIVAKWSFIVIIILFLWLLTIWTKSIFSEHSGFLFNAPVQDYLIRSFWHRQKCDSVVDGLPGHKEITCYAAEDTSIQADIKKPKLILFHNFPDFYELEPASGFEIFNSCPRKCELTTNISRFEEADVFVYYSHYQHRLLDKPPPVKKHGQIWVFFSVESPTYAENSLFGNQQWHGLFNWTMTYRYDSEFWHGYVRTARRTKPVDKDKRVENLKEWKDLFSKKTKLVAWFVSHCDTDSRREKYVAELSKYIQVDIYGKCGTLTCDDRKQCLEMVRTDYKFYLAFENSLCKDYVTEKLKNVFDIGGTVPVVRGGAKYDKLFPPNSVIDVKNFSSPRALARHLHALAANQDAYIKMLEWTWEYEIQGPNLPLCHLCERLYEEPKPMACVYKNVYAWWADNACYKTRDW